MPYSKAKEIGNAQDKALLNLISDEKIDGLSIDEIYKIVQQTTNEIIDDEVVAKTMKH